MRLIDADALKEHTEIVSYKNEWYETEIDEFVSVENIDSAPSIDIVQCKECKEWDKNDHECYLDRGGLYFPNANDYCSYGEREGDDGNNTER